MDYSAKIQSVKEKIEELRQIKDLLYNIEDSICSVENELCAVDESLPSDNDIAKMKPGAEKEQILHLLDLTREGLSLVDELLGPPTDENGEKMGSAYSPEARGNNSGEVSLDEVLKSFRTDKHSVS